IQPETIQCSADRVFCGRRCWVVQQHSVPMIFPKTCYVRADTQGVTQTQRWDDRRATGKEICVIPHGFSHDLHCQAVGGFARYVLMTFAGERAAVEEVEFEIVKSPRADLFHQFGEPFNYSRMSCIERVELFAPIVSGRDKSSARVAQEPIGMFAKEFR